MGLVILQGRGWRVADKNNDPNPTLGNNLNVIIRYLAEDIDS